MTNINSSPGTKTAAWFIMDMVLHTTNIAGKNSAALADLVDDGDNYVENGEVDLQCAGDVFLRTQFAFRTQVTLTGSVRPRRRPTNQSSSVEHK